MTFIKFDVQEAYDYLVQHGRIFTIRRKRLTGTKIPVFSRFYKNGLEKVMTAIIKERFQVTRAEELELCVSESGFTDPVEWWNKANALSGKNGYYALYVYEVARNGNNHAVP